MKLSKLIMKAGALSALVVMSTLSAQAANNERALNRVQNECGISYRTKRVIRNNVKHNSAKLIGGLQTFLHNDGRLILIDLDNRCEIDQVRIDEGPVMTTKAIGKRLFMVVKNSINKKGRLYMLQAYNSSRKPYRVFEVKYNSNGSYAQAKYLKVINRKGQKSQLQIIKKNGKAYKRLEKPSTWGYYNNASHVNNRIEEIHFVDMRTNYRARTYRTNKRQFVLLPRPTCSGVSISFEYLFGFVKEEIVVAACF